MKTENKQRLFEVMGKVNPEFNFSKLNVGDVVIIKQGNPSPLNYNKDSSPIINKIVVITNKPENTNFLIGKFISGGETFKIKSQNIDWDYTNRLSDEEKTRYKNKIIKNSLFEVINPELDNSWAIFRVSTGYGKCFVTSIENNSIHICDYRVKYGDSEVIKLPFEQAKKIVENDWHFDSILGIVNNSGVQFGLGRYDKVWKRI